MSVLQDVKRSEHRRRLAAPRVQNLRPTRDAASSCSCSATSIPAPAGEVLVLRVAGEVDLLTIEVLQDVLTSSLARGPCHLVVDLAELTFCSVRGMNLLVQAGRTAAEQGTGYTVTAASHQVNHGWTLLWPVSQLPTRYPTAAAGVASAVATAGSAGTATDRHTRPQDVQAGEPEATGPDEPDMDRQATVAR
jgi:anti-anti-sigma factor